MSSKYPTPTAEGFYWAKWRIADEGTPEGEQQTPSDSWEVVDVYENSADEKSPEHLRVHVSGQPRSQSLGNFIWGPQVDLPAELAAADAFRNAVNAQIKTALRSGALRRPR